MKALVYGVAPEPVAVPDDANPLVQNLARTPTGLRDMPEPVLPHEDWVLTRPRLTGICGSDAKQILMDFGEGDADNAMSAFCSFPQVMGHEVVADVVALGPGARGLAVGQRVVLNPWLSCGPRGIQPPCPACEAGDYSLCWSFADGDLKPGIHTGVSADVTGGYAELMPAHDSMLFAVPERVPDEMAVFADPFSVSLHAITRHPPPRSGRALVYGAGSLGCARWRSCGRSTRRSPWPWWPASTPRRSWPGASAPPKSLRTNRVRPSSKNWSAGGRLRRPLLGLPMAHPGAVDVVYDTVGKPETLEVAVRLLRSRGTLVKAGVHAPGRWEDSPLYFKEIALVGSNAFGVEEVDGQRRHAIAHYLDLAAAGRVDLRPMLTHTFTLDRWRDAFHALADQGRTGAVKVAFDQR